MNGIIILFDLILTLFPTASLIISSIYLYGLCFFVFISLVLFNSGFAANSSRALTDRCSFLTFSASLIISSSFSSLLSTFACPCEMNPCNISFFITSGNLSRPNELVMYTLLFPILSANSF